MLWVAYVQDSLVSVAPSGEILNSRQIREQVLVQASFSLK
jgi:hypothetical protein